MARIPDADIERLKAEVSLVRLVEASGVALEKRGADHVGRCPFHDDKTPSLVVTPESVALLQQRGAQSSLKFNLGVR